MAARTGQGAGARSHTGRGAACAQFSRDLNRSPRRSVVYSDLLPLLRSTKEFPGKGRGNSLETLNAGRLHTDFHKPKSTEVCFRAASSTKSASTLSWPSKSLEAAEGRE